MTLLAVLLALSLQSLSEGLGPARTRGGSAVGVPGGGAVVYRGTAGLTSRALQDRTVALTFDDGPDPRWTPAVLRVLEREGVPATFFVVGARAARHPELVRRELREGNEVGLHTWSHADLTHARAWRQRLELSLGQLALAGSAGVRSALLRPPYSSVPGAVTAGDLRVLRRATDDGYLVVLTDRDSEDWRRRGSPAIVGAARAVGTSGAAVLMHDGGGDRAQTVQALPELIATYRAAGYRFTTVSGGLGLAPTASDRPAPRLERWQGRALFGTVVLARWLVLVVGWLVVPFGLLAGLRTLLVVGLARRHVRVSAARVSGEPQLPPVSVLVPAYNEAVGIGATVRSLVASDYPVLEVVVIDDGSTDGTAEIVEGLALEGVRVVRQQNGGKAAALQTGIEQSRYGVLVLLDGDTVFEPDTVRHLVQALRDDRVGAVSGNTKVGNRRGLLGRWQHLEYVSGFNLDRRLQDLLGCITTIPGACGAFRREALEDVGGMSEDTLAEDTDVTMAVLRAGWRVVHEERARAWTEAPSSVGDLWRQRWRWAYGTLQCVWKHRAAFRERGPLGRIGLPYMVAFQVVLPLLAPLVDVFALHGLLTGQGTRVALVWGGYALAGVASTAYALHLDRESLRPLWSLPLQQLFYRQLIYLVVLQSLVSALSGLHLPWHKLERTGDVVVPG